MCQHWVITLKNQIKKYMIIHNVVNFGYALLPPFLACDPIVLLDNY